jgi:hypothetical protein
MKQNGGWHRCSTTRLDVNGRGSFCPMNGQSANSLGLVKPFGST